MQDVARASGPALKEWMQHEKAKVNAPHSIDILGRNCLLKGELGHHDVEWFETLATPTCLLFACPPEKCMAHGGARAIVSTNCLLRIDIIADGSDNDNKTKR